MGKHKTPVIRDVPLTLKFSEIEFVKMLSLAVITGGSKLVSFDDQTGKLSFQPIPDDVKTEISESMARLAIHRKKIPKLTTKVIKLSNIATNEAIKSSNETLQDVKDFKAKEKKRLDDIAAALAAKQAAKTK
jgi:hypothetical protein